MKKLWIFGDSFSTPFEKQLYASWSLPYVQWKGYLPKTFGDIIGDELGLEVQHLAEGALGNDTIFETIYTNVPLINKGDIVIIGWSSMQRFRLGNDNNKFVTVIPSLKKYPTLSFISKSTIEEVLVNRTLPIYYDEICKRIIFLNWLFKDMILIQWTPFWDMRIKIWGDSEFSTITNETDGLIVDAHYSELGHKQLANKFLEMIGDDTLRKTINSLCEKDKLI
jgi:hypothetical protein